MDSNVNLSKAQLEKKYKDLGIMTPHHKMNEVELEHALRQRSVKFDSARGRAERSRAATRRKAIRDQD